MEKKYQASLLLRPLRGEIVFEALPVADADDTMINPLVVSTPSGEGEFSEHCLSLSCPRSHILCLIYFLDSVLNWYFGQTASEDHSRWLVAWRLFNISYFMFPIFESDVTELKKVGLHKIY